MLMMCQSRGTWKITGHRTSDITSPLIAKSTELNEREEYGFAGFAWWCTFKDVSLIDSQMAGDPTVVVLHADHRRAGNG